MNDLMIMNDIGGTFSDFSLDAKDFLRDPFDISLERADNILYIGLYKPFNSFYVEGVTFTDPLVDFLDVEFTTNGSVLDVRDDTKGFSRSGFVEFDKPDNWTASTINGVEAYWVRVESKGDIINVNLKGLNLVFSDDNDLAQEVRQLDKLRQAGDTSFIAYHVASRNEIIQTLRNGGYSKKVDGLFANITKWDILDFGEIRQASKYLTLSKIFFDASTNPDDKYENKSGQYEGKFGSAFKLFWLKLDGDDDGEYSQHEDLELNDIEIVRV